MAAIQRYDAVAVGGAASAYAVAQAFGIAVAINVHDLDADLQFQLVIGNRSFQRGQQDIGNFALDLAGAPTEYRQPRGDKAARGILGADGKAVKALGAGLDVRLLELPGGQQRRVGGAQQRGGDAGV